MRELILYKKKNLNSYTINFCGIKRNLPLCRVKKNMWLVGNENLSFGTDIDFTKRIARIMGNKLRRLKPECILTAEAKSLGIAYGIADYLGHKEFALARKSIKSCMQGCCQVSVRSITTNRIQRLVLDEINLKRIRNKRIAIIDDCISTCETIKGLIKLAKRAGARIETIATIWIEGPWPFENFYEQMLKKQFIYLDIFPVYALSNTYKVLKKREERIKAACNLI